MGLGLELIMNICVVSLFPEMVKKILNFGVIGRSEANGIMSLSVINPRDFTDDNYQKVDDKPYGGGPGMVMKYEPLKRSVEMAKEKFSGTAPVILLSPQGAAFNQKTAKRFSQYSELIFVCGRYEGIDQRILEKRKNVKENSVPKELKNILAKENPKLDAIQANISQINSELSNLKSSEKEAQINLKNLIF